PVPLAATFENQNAVVATTYSKSALRAAVDHICRKFEFADYFPSYEMITNWYNEGKYFENDLRSITKGGVEHVMRIFERHYLSAGQKLTAAFAPSSARNDAIKEQINRAMKVICDDELLDSDLS